MPQKPDLDFPRTVQPGAQNKSRASEDGFIAWVSIVVCSYLVVPSQRWGVELSRSGDPEFVHGLVRANGSAPWFQRSSVPFMWRLTRFDGRVGAATGDRKTRTTMRQTAGSDAGFDRWLPSLPTRWSPRFASFLTRLTHARTTPSTSLTTSPPFAKCGPHHRRISSLGKTLR
jgi:hypothetical protein